MKELAPPPGKPVPWTFRYDGSTTIVTGSTFFEARKKACIVLGAPPEEIEWVKDAFSVPTNPGTVDCVPPATQVTTTGKRHGGQDTTKRMQAKTRKTKAKAKRK